MIESRLNSMFELATLDEIDKLRDTEGGSGNSSSGELELEDLEDIDKTLHIKGQMIFIQDSAANRLIGEVVQSRRRPLLGPSPALRVRNKQELCNLKLYI